MSSGRHGLARFSWSRQPHDHQHRACSALRCFPGPLTAQLGSSTGRARLVLVADRAAPAAPCRVTRGRAAIGEARPARNAAVAARMNELSNQGSSWPAPATAGGPPRPPEPAGGRPGAGHVHFPQCHYGGGMARSASGSTSAASGAMTSAAVAGSPVQTGTSTNTGLPWASSGSIGSAGAGRSPPAAPVRVAPRPSRRAAPPGRRRPGRTGRSAVRPRPPGRPDGRGTRRR